MLWPKQVSRQVVVTSGKCSNQCRSTPKISLGETICVCLEHVKNRRCTFKLNCVVIRHDVLARVGRFPLNICAAFSTTHVFLLELTKFLLLLYYAFWCANR